MTDDDLRAFIERQESRATRPQVEAEQAQAMSYYLRQPFGNEEEGRSQAISSDVWEVVEGMTPDILEPFVASADVVKFNAFGPEDEEAASQETDYLNYVVTQKNDSFIQLHQWVKAGLLQKNGIVKYWWDKTRRVSFETYRDLTSEQLSMLLQDENAKVIEATENPGAVVESPQGPMQLPPTYDVKLRHVEEDGRARFEVVPPEEFLIIGRDPNPQNASFVQHRSRVTISDLREMGYDVPDDINDGGSGDISTAPQAAVRNVGNDQWQDNTTTQDGNGDPSMREVWYRETYCRVDFDGDGVSELRRVCLVGTTTLANEECEEIQFAAWTPYQQLWQFDGRCPADEAIEIQDIKSTLWRQALDNIYTINNNRVFANENVNLDDLLDNQIAGIVRVSGKNPVGQDVASLPVAPLGQIIHPMIEYADSVKENRTGFTRYNQGSADLGNQKTLGEVRLVSQAGSRRLRLIQRSLAEQGMKPLMLGLHGLLRRHATRAETVQLRGKWINIDPRSWKRRIDMTVGVGPDTMDKDAQLMAQRGIVLAQQQAFAVGVVTPENVYNANAKMVELTGEKAVDKYFTHPSKMPKQQPPDPMQNPEFMLKVKESKQKDRDLDLKEAAVKQDDKRIAIEAQRLGIDRAQAQIDALKTRHEMELETKRHDREMKAPHPQELAAAQQAREMERETESDSDES